jgi:hypothetical protein
MHDVHDPWQAVFEALIALRDGWPGPVSGWGYDRRLKCVMASFTTGAIPAAEAAIAHAMPAVFGAESLAEAPPSARATAETCGGLRASQRLYWGADPVAPGGGAFGLWWPWADGATVSLRIGLHDVDVPKERLPRLRDVFGIPQSPPAT